MRTVITTVLWGGLSELTNEKCFESAIPLWEIHYMDLKAPSNKNIYIRMFSATFWWQKNKTGNNTSMYPTVFS